jgi:hypothetical protein
VSDTPDRLRAARKEVADALAVAIEDIENLRALYAHACDSCRREAERAERAEARIDELLARLNTRTTGDVEGA